MTDSTIAISGCDEDGNRRIRLTCTLAPSTPTDQVQWYIDGEPFGPVMHPGAPYTGKVPGDGQSHLIELKVVSPANATGDTAEVTFPECLKQPVAAVASIDFGREDPQGLLPIRLTSHITNETGNELVQWTMDGVPLGSRTGAGPHIANITSDGKTHEFAVQVVSPDTTEPDAQTIQLPSPKREPASATIKTVDFDETDGGQGNDESPQERKGPPPGGVPTPFDPTPEAEFAVVDGNVPTGGVLPDEHEVGAVAGGNCGTCRAPFSAGCDCETDAPALQSRPLECLRCGMFDCTCLDDVDVGASDSASGGSLCEQCGLPPHDGSCSDVGPQENRTFIYERLPPDEHKLELMDVPDGPPITFGNYMECGVCGEQILGRHDCVGAR